MDRGPAARGGSEGGEPIPAPRETRARVALAASALAVGLPLAAYPVAAADGWLAWLALGLGGGGIFVLALSLAARAASLVPLALVLLGAEYSAWIVVRGQTLDERAPLVAAGLLLVAELSYWSFERHAGGADAAILPRRLATLFGLVLGSIALGVLLLAAASAPAGGGVVLEAAGVACAVGLFVLVSLLARRLMQEEPEP